MKTAIPIWNGRVSPVMDTACHLLVTEIDTGKEISRTIITLPPTNASQRASFLSGLGIDTLICGAISYQLNQMLKSWGIRTYPWIRGEVEEVIAAHSAGAIQNDKYLLPGCGRRRRRERMRQRGLRRGFGRHKLHEEDK